MSNTRSEPRTCLVIEPGLARVTASGPDAADFLDAQSMTALGRLEDFHVQRCAFADAKGRVVTTALAWHAGDDWRFILPAGEADWFVSHLLRFRFRSKVEIATDTAWQVAALFGDGVADTLEAAGVDAPDPGTATVADELEIAVTTDGRCLVAGHRADMAAVLEKLSAASESTDPAQWHAAGMQAGDVVVAEPTRGRFLPQFLDLDQQDVIAWDKGCYPGQEVIARLQHRGTVKHRLLLLAEDVDAFPGSRAEVAGITVEVVGHGRLPDGRPVTQVVAPYPFDPKLEAHAL